MHHGAKLTLSVPEEAVKRAKAYARRHHTSVSALVTRLFQALESRLQSPSQAQHHPKAATLTERNLGLISLPLNKKADLISEALLHRHSSS